MRVRLIAAGLAMLAAPGLPGCAGFSHLVAPRTAVENPLVVPSADFETVWKATLAVLDDYFTVRSENRLSRKIVTDPKPGSTLFEPWSGDSVTLGDRIESSMQTIRRHAEVTVSPAPGGGYLVKVEVFKELEDMARPDRQAAGRAVFNNDFPINRTREIVGPVPLPAGWILRGRDATLEHEIVRRIRDSLFL